MGSKIKALFGFYKKFCNSESRNKINKSGKGMGPDNSLGSEIFSRKNKHWAPFIWDQRVIEKKNNEQRNNSQF